MTVRERFAREHGMTGDEVRRLVRLARMAGERNERFCNGDPHPNSSDPEDKSENSAHWATSMNAVTDAIIELITPHGFTGVEYTGLGPTLKRGERFVEIPY